MITRYPQSTVVPVGHRPSAHSESITTCLLHPGVYVVPKPQVTAASQLLQAEIGSLARSVVKDGFLR